MDAYQWVAMPVLDVRDYTSGSSIHRPLRISSVGNPRVRRAVYMPAQVAIMYDPHVGAFHNRLMTRGEKPMVAGVAVIRKLLHVIYGMLKHGVDFDGSNFYAVTNTTWQ